MSRAMFVCVDDAERPRIRTNQLGYLPDGPKRATWVTDAVDPAAFAVHGPDGEVVLRGMTEPWPVRPEPSSGTAVHVIDFSALTRPGDGYRLVIGDETGHPVRIAPDPYAPLARDALQAFYLLRSGCPIEESRAPGYSRPAGHAGVAPNRGDTAVPGWTGPDAERLYPGWRAPEHVDVSGGWYDAGDYGKYVVSGSVALWQLLSTLRLRREAALVEECRWQLDWLLRMQVPPGQPLAGMAYHRVHGTAWSPLPGWAHEDPTPRVVHRPSTAATLHLAAVTACAARLLDDAEYVGTLLAAAASAYRAAGTNPVLIAPDDEGRFGGGPYGDPDVDDDRYWAAAELWLATGEQCYLDDVLASSQHTGPVFELGGFDFDRVAPIARLDLALAGQALPDHERVVASVIDAAQRLVDLARAQPWGQPYAPPDGWCWGSNGRLLNNLVVLATAHEHRFRDTVVSGVDYLFGRNALGQSYVTGYGVDATAHLRTRQFGHDLDPGMPPLPPGLVAGGPNSQPTPGFPHDPRLAWLPPQRCYLDEPTSETTNDICIRWNAPLVYVATYLQG